MNDSSISFACRDHSQEVPGPELTLPAGSIIGRKTGRGLDIFPTEDGKSIKSIRTSFFLRFVEHWSFLLVVLIGCHWWSDGPLLNSQLLNGHLLLHQMLHTVNTLSVRPPNLQGAYSWRKFINTPSFLDKGHVLFSQYVTSSLSVPTSCIT